MGDTDAVTDPDTIFALSAAGTFVKNLPSPIKNSLTVNDPLTFTEPVN